MNREKEVETSKQRLREAYIDVPIFEKPHESTSTLTCDLPTSMTENIRNIVVYAYNGSASTYLRSLVKADLAKNLQNYKDYIANCNPTIEKKIRSDKYKRDDFFNNASRTSKRHIDANVIRKDKELYDKCHSYFDKLIGMGYYKFSVDDKAIDVNSEEDAINIMTDGKGFREEPCCRTITIHCRDREMTKHLADNERYLSKYYKVPLATSLFELFINNASSMAYMVTDKNILKLMQ